METKMVNIIIDGINVQVPSDFTVLKACESIDISIPRLCYLKGIHEEANCRLCIVKIKGMNGLKVSCKTIVAEGMEITTDSDEIRQNIKLNLELLAADHRFDCWNCPIERTCEFLHYLKRYHVDNVYSKERTFSKKEIEICDSNEAIVFDSSKCILCQRCVSTCQNLVGLHVLDFKGRGSKAYVGTAGANDISDSGCIYCGKCLQFCPTAAITEKDYVDQVLHVLKDKTKTVIVEVAPAVRAALGEEFGYPIGTNVEAKMFEALEKLGFAEIMDTNFAADVTIMEEGTELLTRINEGGKLPLFTSCSPGWIRFIEQYKPEFLENVSTCKSPQQMGGAIIKHYYSKKLGIDKKDIVVVSVMPCIAKKYEANRPEMVYDGVKDVDYVLSTRELARLIKREEIDFNSLKGQKPHGMLASYTGAAVIFGATGGVMEAALRTVSEILEEKPTPVEFTEVRGLKEIKEASYMVAGKQINVAVVHGAKAIKEFFKLMETEKKEYHFVEFMGCVGGCVNGGGQPRVRAKYYDENIKALRAKVLYDIDDNAELRKSHLNKEVQTLYSEYLGKPNSHLAHEILHTTYTKKDFYTKE